MIGPASSNERQRHGKIDGALQTVAGIARLSAQFQGDETIELAELQAKRCEFTELVDHQDLPSAQPIQRIWIPWQRPRNPVRSRLRRAVRRPPPIKRAEQRQCRDRYRPRLVRRHDLIDDRRRSTPSSMNPIGPSPQAGLLSNRRANARLLGAGAENGGWSTPHTDRRAAR